MSKMLTVLTFWPLWAGVAVLFVLTWLWWRRGVKRMSRPLPEPVPLKRRRNHLEGRCILVYGRLGSGKTALVMQRAVKHARKLRIPLIANADVRGDAVVLRSWADLAALELCRELEGSCVNDSTQPCPGCHPGVIVLDEIHMWLPSQPGLMPNDQVREAVHLLSYARKRGWTIYATTQYPTRVSTQFRYLCTEMIEVRAYSQGFLHWMRQIDPDSGKQILGFAGFFFPRRARYNTRAEVEPLWNLGKEPQLAKPAGQRIEATRARQVAQPPPAPTFGSASPDFRVSEFGR